MAISVSIEINRAFDVKADFDTVFKTLADVPQSVSHFPKVDQLVPLGDNTYRWEMQKVGVDKYAVQTVYACKYHANKDTGVITWEPVPGVGNGVVSGSWQIKAVDGGTQIRFSTKGSLDIPVPSLLKLAISPVVKHEFNALIDTYIENLQKALS